MADGDYERGRSREIGAIAAGRMLDCSREAFGALRVMVNCNQMGEAAGRAAARAVKGAVGNG